MDWGGEALKTYRRFQNNQTWRDSAGYEWPIKEMENDHLLNTLRYVKRNAQQIAFLHGWGAMMAVGNGPNEHTVAFDTVEEGLRRLWTDQMSDPVEWIKTTPLVRAMNSEYLRRMVKRCKCGRVWNECHDDAEPFGASREQVLGGHGGN
jgi:hypothetical protein